MSHLERLQDELHAIAQPLVQHLAEVEREIETTEAALKELIEARRQLTGVVRRIDPELAPVKKQETKTKSWGPSQEKVDAMAEWLREHAEEINANGGIHASALEKREDFTVVATTSIPKAMSALHEQGVIRLDHMGTGGSKHYKVVV